MDSAPAERGLPLVWRAGPAGAPAGGSGVSEIIFASTGLHGRPWSPAHLRCAPRGGGFDLTWHMRSRLDGDRWDGESRPSDPFRFRIRVLNAGAAVRTFEVEATSAFYPAPEVATDFPEGTHGAEIGVAQWGDGYGWGAEMRIRLI